MFTRQIGYVIIDYDPFSDHPFSDTNLFNILYKANKYEHIFKLLIKIKLVHQTILNFLTLS